MLSAKEIVRKELSNLIKDFETNITVTTSEQAVQTSVETLIEQKKPGLLDFLKQRKPTIHSTASAFNLMRMYLETEPEHDEAETAKAAVCAGTFWGKNKH
ncbi:unnamed protein product [Parnassius apollo]|uniref:(apollo) hypothetical protein n=1 Tax=Parnassius apollo TaxID=110799 RepID=A0A8S3XNX2_PARAO|nr:unnamed protein product [Parnassius apollo]